MIMRNYSSVRNTFHVSITATTPEESLAIALGMPFAMADESEMIRGVRRNVDVMDPEGFEIVEESEVADVVDVYTPVDGDVIIESETGELSVVVGVAEYPEGEYEGRWLLIEREDGTLAEVHEGAWLKIMNKASRRAIIPALAKLMMNRVLIAA